MRSEWGTLVRGSDPPSGYSVHNTAGDTWQAPARCLTQIHLAAGVYKTDGKKSRSLFDGKKKKKKKKKKKNKI